MTRLNETTNIHHLKIDDKEVILIGTAHVSKKSAEIVKETIELEVPDIVCIELDQGRFDSLKNKESWKNTDITQIIKNGQSGYFFINIILSNYQRRLAEQFNINSGQEMLQAIESCKYVGAELVLADRDIQITFKRIWQGCSLWEKLKLLVTVLMSIFEDGEISEEDLESLQQEDILSAALSEMGETFKNVKKHLLDERDQYLAYIIKSSKGKKIVAVLGAAHVPGVISELDKEQDIESITKIKGKSNSSKIRNWIIPILFIGLILITFSINPASGIDQTLYWLLLTSGGAGLGALCALAHPLTILFAIIVAPISALHPVLAAGWFAGLSETYFRKPKVQDFENLAIDLKSFKGFWTNGVMRILLTVILTNLGCAIGNISGSLNIIQLFLQNYF